MSMLKMVNGERYCCPPVFADRVILRDEVVEVSDPKFVEVLLSDTFFDNNNNEVNYFEEVDENAPAAGKGGKGKAKVATTATRTRARASDAGDE